MSLQRLGDFVKIRTGKLDANASSPDGEFPFFTCAVEPLRINSYSYDCECVLIAGNGDLNVKHYSGKFDAYQRTYIVETLDSAKLNFRYLYHFMERYVGRLRQMSIGGVIKYIKLGYLTEAQIPLPPLEEQRRIAEVLDRADAVRQKRRLALQTLDSLLQSVFLDMFGDPVSNSKAWNIRSMTFLCRNVTDGTHHTPKRLKSGVPFITTKNVRPFKIDLSVLEYVSKETHEEIKQRCDPR
jgi:type I restriction enzyme S subunit